MLRTKARLIATVALAVGLLGRASTPANATLQIAATINSTTFTCVDNAACDTRDC
jgi:hypothetical protein